MGIILGLAAALLYGGSDFGGGMLSRQLGSLRVNVIGSVAATALAWAALFAFGAPAPSLHAVVWGLASGLGGGAGTLVLYRGLARGQMSVVGPLSAVASAAVPVAVGVALGERPSVLAAAGVLVALPAIVLVAASGPVRGKLAGGLGDGLAAGAAFGVMFIGLAQAGANGLWPVAAEQTGSMLLILAVALRSRESLPLGGVRGGRPPRRQQSPVRAAVPAVLVGVSGMAATLLYFYATHFAMMATAAVLVSLYPGVTVLLARMILHERFSPVQRAGLSLCTLAVVAIALN
jgi:drug/metabolite transporter (DMT)-like permease